MTFWDATPNPFDPTEPSSAELLEDWSGAIQLMTREQCLERIIFMLIRDRKIAIQTQTRDNEDGFMSNPFEAYCGEDTRKMLNEHKRVFGMSTPNLFQSENSWWLDSKNGIMMVAANPGLMEDGVPDWIPPDRKEWWLSIDTPRHWIYIYMNSDWIYRFIPVDASGTPLNKQDLLGKVQELSRRWGLPVLPEPTIDSGRTSSAMFDIWRDDKTVMNLALCPCSKQDEHGKYTMLPIDQIPSHIARSKDFFLCVHMMRKMDEQNPSWRKSVLENVRDGISPVGWPRVEVTP